MGRSRKYTPLALRKKIEQYLSSISRTAPVTEKVDSGEVDKYGHTIWSYVPVKNDAGETITHREFMIPPTVGGICEFLGVHPSTWSEWSKTDGYREVTEHAKTVLQKWREEQLLTRKDVRGIIFDLQNNYNFAEKREVEFGEATRQTITKTMTIEEKEELLKEIAQEWGGDGGGRAED